VLLRKTLIPNSPHPQNEENILKKYSCKNEMHKKLPAETQKKSKNYIAKN